MKEMARGISHALRERIEIFSTVEAFVFILYVCMMSLRPFKCGSGNFGRGPYLCLQIVTVASHSTFNSTGHDPRFQWFYHWNNSMTRWLVVALAFISS